MLVGKGACETGSARVGTAPRVTLECRDYGCKDGNTCFGAAVLIRRPHPREIRLLKLIRSDKNQRNIQPLRHFIAIPSTPSSRR